MPRNTFMIPTPEPAAAFLRDLTELSRKHKIALSGEPILFEMEPEDMGTEYRADDDRSAVTIWLPKSVQRRAELSNALRRMAEMVLDAPPETGLD